MANVEGGEFAPVAVRVHLQHEEHLFKGALQLLSNRSK